MAYPCSSSKYFHLELNFNKKGYEPAPKLHLNFIFALVSLQFQLLDPKADPFAAGRQGKPQNANHKLPHFSPLAFICVDLFKVVVVFLCRRLFFFGIFFGLKGISLAVQRKSVTRWGKSVLKAKKQDVSLGLNS